jgi:glyceraldehyde 3-phosphate dehydrogenase
MGLNLLVFCLKFKVILPMMIAAFIPEGRMQEPYMNLAINGFGRIGRGILRAALEQNRLQEIVAIHDFASVQASAHLLKYDSIFGRLKQPVEFTRDSLKVGNHSILYLHKITDFTFPWKDLSVDVVLECTGKLTDTGSCTKHLDAGARRVLLSAPAKDKEIKTLVYGVNHQHYQPQTDRIVSNASCTTNCLAPIVHVLNKEFGVERAMMTTVHSYTNDQRILDTDHSDLRRARAAAMNIIPTTTGAARVVGKVIPELSGKIDGFALRVPTADVSFVDCVALLRKPATPQTLNQTFREYAHGSLKGILDITDEPIVSSDLIGSTYSSVVDAGLTMTLGETLVKICSWYDNEYGFCNRMLDMSSYMTQ